MVNLRTTEMLFVEELFGMGGGYVLDFSNQSFARFFADELSVNIEDPRYARDGTSKAKRLRCFLQTVDKSLAGRTLEALWEYREAIRLRENKTETTQNADARMSALISTLTGRLSAAQPRPAAAAVPAPVPTHDPARLAELQTDLLKLSQLAPQPRGYAFERFLKRLFDLHGLDAKEPFRLRGEQIDGSFLLASETYLLEAKWQNAPIGVAELHTFHGKVEQKAAWARGLFISNSGFTKEGLDAWGRAKRVICMDGLDLYETLNRGLPLTQVIERKIRRAAETGLPFIGVRDLFSN